MRLTLGVSDTAGSSAATECPPERVCDGCFNRLVHESSQVSPDHFRIKQLKLSACELMDSLAMLIESLDDPDGSLKFNLFRNSLTFA